MSEQSVSRRGALLAAANIGALIAVADAQAGEGNALKPKPEVMATKIKLTVTLPDGQVLAFNAKEATIEFGALAQLHVTPAGITTKLLASEASPTPLSDAIATPSNLRNPGGFQAQPMRIESTEQDPFEPGKD